jgi:hypothetical protein
VRDVDAERVAVDRDAFDVALAAPQVHLQVASRRRGAEAGMARESDSSEGCWVCTACVYRVAVLYFWRGGSNKFNSRYRTVDDEEEIFFDQLTRNNCKLFSLHFTQTA